MKNFMGKDFLLESETASKLYHDYAENLPIIDYHCHINPAEIADDRTYENITQVWLYGDHYKWRVIRNNGVDEEYITGNASDFEKFMKYAEVMPKLIGNPLYHWTHLELKEYFGYDGVLCSDTADEVWSICNEKLKELSVREIIKLSDVRVICTTDDPVDDLCHHDAIRRDESFSTKVLPAFRPDKILNIDKEGFADYMKKLSVAGGIEVSDLVSLKKAVSNRIDFFNGMGCRASDHAFEHVMCRRTDDKSLGKILKKGLERSSLSVGEIEKYKTEMLIFLAGEYNKRDWVMQIHYGTQRNNNSRMFDRLGPDTGYDCISSEDSSKGLVDLLNAMENGNCLGKTIIYSLNPNDDAMIDSVAGSFQGTAAPGKIQHGSAWWFNDTKKGMIKQLESLAATSVLGNFIGMLTDSRSFLSYTRHEYFRRILCNLIGGWIENGECPNDPKYLKELIQGICYYNVKRYFGFDSD